MSMRHAFREKEKPKVKGLGSKGLGKGLGASKGLGSKAASKPEAKSQAPSASSSSSSVESSKPVHEPPPAVSLVFVLLHILYICLLIA